MPCALDTPSPVHGLAQLLPQPPAPAPAAAHWSEPSAETPEVSSLPATTHQPQCLPAPATTRKQIRESTLAPTMLTLRDDACSRRKHRPFDHLLRSLCKAYVAPLPCLTRLQASKLPWSLKSRAAKYSAAAAPASTATNATGNWRGSQASGVRPCLSGTYCTCLMRRYIPACSCWQLLGLSSSPRQEDSTAHTSATCTQGGKSEGLKSVYHYDSKNGVPFCT